MTAQLLRIEATKNFRYSTFWWITSLSFLLMGLVFYATGFTEATEHGKGITLFFERDVNFSFPEIWLTFTHAARGFLLFPAVLILLLVCNEYQFRTIRQNLIDGFSRSAFFFSKLITLIFICLGTVLFVFVMGLILGLAYSNDTKASVVFSHLEVFPILLLQAVTFTSLAFMLAHLIRKTGLAIVVLLLYYIIIENILLRVIPQEYHRYLLMRSMNQLQKVGDATAGSSIVNLESVVIVCCYLFTFLLVSFFVVKRRDV